MISGGGIVFMLPQKGVTVYDEEKNTVREIRYCPNEPSIWTDEQGEKATRKSVIFREKRLFVPKDKPNLREFMERHPGNAANGGAIFKEVDKKRDAEDELKKEFLQTDAIAMVRDKDIQDLLRLPCSSILVLTHLYLISDTTCCKSPRRIQGVHRSV